MAHAGLRREMHHLGEAMLGEQRRHADTVGEVEPDETKRRRLCELVEACLLERRIIIGVEIVETDDVAGIRGETARDMEAMNPAAPVTRIGLSGIGVFRL